MGFSRLFSIVPILFENKKGEIASTLFAPNLP